MGSAIEVGYIYARADIASPATNIRLTLTQMFDPELILEMTEASEDMPNYGNEIEQLKANLEPSKCQMERSIEAEEQEQFF